MLKLAYSLALTLKEQQPPSGGCVLKHPAIDHNSGNHLQPPSGGCVLKLWRFRFLGFALIAAAFGRLCVETYKTDAYKLTKKGMQPPSGGCVLKRHNLIP